MVLHGKERKMIYSIYCFMKREADNGEVSNLKQCMKRTAAAANTSVATVRRIVKEARDSDNQAVFRTPGKKRLRQKPITDVDNINKGIIKRTIFNYHITEKELPTIEKLRRKLQRDINFQGSDRSLGRIIENLGFKFKRTENKGTVLVEKSNIRFQRIEYLKRIKKYREEGRPVVYTDESYIDNSRMYHWADGKPISKGQRLVVVLAGGETGFVPNALHTFTADTNSGDYRNKMSYESYEKWLRTQLIPNLPTEAVVIIGNASYHNKQYNPAPTSNARKAVMQAWLTQKNVQYDESMLKPELYDLIRRHKDKVKKFNVDKILAEKGHIVLRLPPYHMDLNPIQMTLSDIKGHVASKNVSWNINLVTELVQEKMNLIGEKQWEELCRRIKDIEDEYRETDHVVDNMTETFIIRADDDDYDDDDSESNDDYNYSSSGNSDEDDEVLTPSTSNAANSIT